MTNYGSMNESIICLPGEMLRDFNLTPDQEISFQLGLQEFQGRIQEANSANGCPCFLLQGQRRLGLMPGTKVQLAKTDRGLELGPLLGVLCSGGPVELLWTELELARCIIQLGHKLGMVAHLVTPDSLDLNRKQAYGYSIKDNTWYLEEIPFPTVFYNRVYILPSPEAVNKYNLLFEAAANNDLKIYNRSRLDKWSLYQLLQEESELPVNVPHTRPYTLLHLTEFMQLYPSAYLKPCSASLSQGLVRIKTHSEKYLCEYHDNRGEKQQKLTHDPEEIAAFMEPNQDYLIQQGVALASIGDRPADFRVHVHKDGEGVWQLVYVAGRLGGVHGVTTRPIYGGSREPALALLARLFPGQEREYMERLTSAAIAVAQCLDKKIDTGLGELGCDLGFDIQGQLWFFEANERPSGYHLISLVPGAYERLGMLILQYSCYLAGIGNQSLTKLLVIDND